MEEMEKKEPINTEMDPEDIAKYFKTCMNGEESYKAVQLFLEVWWERTNDNLLLAILSSMHIDQRTMEDWAYAIKATIEGRKGGKRNYVYERVTDLVKDSCLCDTCPCKQCDPK